jgi:protein-tyrosine phosphatase
MVSPVDAAHTTREAILSSPRDLGRDLQVRGFANLRDVGGYRAGRERTTRWRTLLRADMPQDLDPVDRPPLVGLPARTVVDLRDDDEVADAPSVFTHARFDVVRCPIFDGSAASFVERRVTLTDLYAHMIGSCGRTLARAVRAIADSDPAAAVLVHCSAGKDRTGVTVALALSAVGVETSDVVSDYARTEGRLRGPWLERRLRELGAHHGADLSGSAELVGGSPAAVIVAALDLVDARWGSPRGYLLDHGLTSRDLERLTARLTEPASPARQPAATAGRIRP